MIPERAQQLNRAGAAAVPAPATTVPPPPPVPNGQPGDLDRLIVENMRDPEFVQAWLTGQQRDLREAYGRGYDAACEDLNRANIRAAKVAFRDGVAEGRRQATDGRAVPEHLVGDGPHCHDCGTVNIRWYAESPIWNRVMGGPDARDDPGGVICVRCFVVRADAAGFNPPAWRLTLPTTSERKAESCEWWPEQGGPAVVGQGGCINTATVLVGASKSWHLCSSCATLPRFKRVSQRRLVGPWEPAEQDGADHGNR